MSEPIKRNCNSCKKSMFGRCKVLKDNDEYKAIKDDGILSEKKFEFKEKFVCDEYKSIYHSR